MGEQEEYLEALERVVPALQKSARATKRKIEAARKKIERARSRVNTLKVEQQGYDWALRVVTQFQFIQLCTLRPVWQLRHELQALVEESKREDITVAQQKDLRQRVAAKKIQLQSTCSHPLVIHSDGYEGSSSWDYDDARCGDHACVVCGLSKTDDDYKGNNSTFPHDDTRLANRLFNDCEHMPYEERRKVTLHQRRDYYLGLKDTNVLTAEFFGERRFKHLRAVIARVSKTT